MHVDIILHKDFALKNSLISITSTLVLSLLRFRKLIVSLYMGSNLKQCDVIKLGRSHSNNFYVTVC